MPTEENRPWHFMRHNLSNYCDTQDRDARGTSDLSVVTCIKCLNRLDGIIWGCRQRILEKMAGSPAEGKSGTRD